MTGALPGSRRGHSRGSQRGNVGCSETLVTTRNDRCAARYAARVGRISTTAVFADIIQSCFKKGATTQAIQRWKTPPPRRGFLL